MQNLPDAIRNMKDERYLKLLRKTIKNPVQKGVAFPGFPSADVQTTFVGSANETSLNEAFQFWQLVKREARLGGRPLQRDSRLLDFGCGWGRYLRFFWKDIDVANLHGCDVNDMIVTLCRDLQVPGQIDHIDPLGTLPYQDGGLDHAMAYSVFTHLPEPVHLHWMRELARVMAPGGIFCLTLESRRFLDFIAQIPPQPNNAWYAMLAAHKPRLPDYCRDYDADAFVFMPTNKGVESTYGDAAVPLSWIRERWQPWFEVLTYIDDPARFWQAVLVVRRTGVALSAAQA